MTLPAGVALRASSARCPGGLKAFKHAALAQIICLVALWWVAALPAAAGEPSFGPALTQYAHASWRVQDGNFGGPALNITQTNDGYLWVGTAAGLERYDGAAFHRWPLPLDRPVYAVRATRDGSLWAGQGGSLVQLKDGRTTSWDVKGRVVDIHEDVSGAIWIARSRAPAHEGGACELRGSGFRCVGPEPCDSASSVTRDSSGGLWIGGAAGACSVRPDGTATVVGKETGTADLFSVRALEAQPDGSMLVGFERSGPHVGLQRVTGQNSRPFLLGGLNGEELEVSSLLTDRQGVLWIGTSAAGIYRIDHGRVDRFTSADGLSGDSVNAFFEDREGNVWVATTAGLDRFHKHAVVTFTTREGLGGSGGDSVLVRRDGSVLVSLLHGISILKDGIARRELWADRIAPHTVTSMLEDHAGRLWLGADDDLLFVDGNSPRPVRTKDGGKVGELLGLAEDDLHDVWAMPGGRPYRIFRVHNGGPAQEIRLPGDRQPQAMAGGLDGAIWFVAQDGAVVVYRSGRPAVFRGPLPVHRYPQLVVLRNNDAVLSTFDGAYYLRGGRWTLLNKARGLPCDNMITATIDGDGELWLRGQCGMMIIAQADLQRALDQPKEALKVRLLDGVDGARPGTPPFWPAVAAEANGRLWFASDNFPLTVDPAHLPTNGLPPPVHIEQVVADHRTYAIGKTISLPPRTRDLEIDYSGLSFVAPQKMRFRYRLSGVDTEWQDVGTRRAAFYMNLKPGRYRFQIIASNNDGVWNNTGDSLDLEIRPAFYQTLWFQGLSVALLLGLVWLGVWLRIRYVTAEIETRLSERQAERLRIARELHDTLLQGFQGLLMRFQVAADAIPKRSPAKPMMEAVLSRAEEVLIEGRDRVHDLRSSDAGASPMLDELHNIAFGLEQDGCGPIEVRCAGVPRPLDGDAQREILAIAKEALTNACRHAKASQILCDLAFSGSHVRLVCEDNGVGIDPVTMKAGGREGHWGLTGMRERARQAGGVLTVQSVPGNTRITFSLNTRLAALRRLGKRLMSVRSA